jgi:hypothetical protein
MATATVLKVYARLALAGPLLRADEPALLLEGSWRDGGSAFRYSLDEAIDARQAWIDEEASQTAHALASDAIEGHELGISPASCPGPAYLNELKLRYYLVKLLRVVAFFGAARTFQSAAGPLLCLSAGSVNLFVSRHRDEDYADLLESIAAAHGFLLTVTWRDGVEPPASSAPPNRWWRRAAAILSSRANPSWRDDGVPRVFLCGSRRVLGGICHELVARGSQVAWLYDRFAVRTWLRWRRAGVAQLVCSDPSRTDCRSVHPTLADFQGTAHVACRGIDLSVPLSRWLTTIEREHGPHQAQLYRCIDAHFARLRPTALLLDEDATPMARAAVAAARRQGVPSVVVQHGVPRVKFGFAPLAADHILVWGTSSRGQLLRWGVPSGRIRVVGRADCQSARREPARGRRREIVLFATTPPRDDRPDAVAFHLTSDAHRQMLRAACAAVASIPRARLTIKLHPRCGDAGPFRAIAADFPELRCRVVRGGDAVRLARRAACVINCTSSAGSEAAAIGTPVIELIPEGSADLLPAREWNTLGTARTEPELRALLHVAIHDDAIQRSISAGQQARVFAAVGHEAARCTVDEVLSIAASGPEGIASTPHSCVSSSSSSKDRRRSRGRGRRRGRVVASSNP